MSDVNVWPTVQSIPVSAVTDDRPPSGLRPPRPEEVAGTAGTGRDTGGGPATGVGTAGARKSPGAAQQGARQNPATDLGFSGDPGQHGVPGDSMLHAQRTWDGTLATNRMDDLGVNAERQRVENKDVTTSVGLVIDGHPQDVRACVQSLIDRTDATVLAIDLGNVEGAGDVLRELAEREPERIRYWRVAEAPSWRGGTADRSAARVKLLQLDTSEVHVLMDTSLALDGDALSPLVAAVRQGAVAAGLQGLERAGEMGTTGDTGATDVMAGAGAGGEGDVKWRPAGPGKVEVLLGDLMAVRRSAALGAFPEQGRYSALELSRALRGELVVPDEHLPVRRLREHDVTTGQR